jgi:hypothetical protein
MRILIIILSFSLLLVSCGGSSSGGSGDSSGGTFTRRNPSKPSGVVKALSAVDAEDLLEKSRTNLENISVGDVFEKHIACEDITNGESSKGDYIKNYTVMSIDRVNRRVSYKIDVVSFPGLDDCGYVGTEFKSFILKEYIYGQYGDSLIWYIENLIKNRKFGLIDSGVKKVLLVNGELDLGDVAADPDMTITKNVYEVGADLNQSFMAGYYKLAEFKANIIYEGTQYTVESYSSEYTFRKESVDVSEIDTSTLPVFYSDPNQ